MGPVEILEVVTDDDGYVTEILGSAELLEKCKDQFIGVKRTVREPEMFKLALPELGENDGK